MAVSVVSFSFSRAAHPEARDSLCCLCLLHLISNWSGPQVPSGFPRAPSAGCGFPYYISSITPSQTVCLLSWLSYIIVQRPPNRLLDLWNGMFDRHQAEITIMHIRGHSLPVHHSEVGPSPCPILSAELTCMISSHNCHWNVSLPSGASLWMEFLAGSKVKIQHIFKPNFFSYSRCYYVFTQSLHHCQDLTLSHFLSKIKLVQIQSLTFS